MIHTDTMIWYNLNLTNENLDEMKSLDIKPNYCNILEIGSSFNIIKNPLLMQKAIDNMSYFSAGMILLPPYQDFMNVTTGATFDRQFQMELAKSFEKILNEDGSYLIEYMKSLSTELISLIDEENKKYIDLTNSINEILFTTKRKFKNKNEKKAFMANRRKEVEPLYNFFNKCSIKAINIELPRDEFLEREFFIAVFNEFFLERELLDQAKVEPNDWNDLLQMLYVKKGDLFWTKEKKWNRLAKQAGMEKYLFEGDRFLLAKMPTVHTISSV